MGTHRCMPAHVRPGVCMFARVCRGAIHLTSLDSNSASPGSDYSCRITLFSCILDGNQGFETAPAIFASSKAHVSLKQCVLRGHVGKGTAIAMYHATHATKRTKSCKWFAKVEHYVSTLTPGLQWSLACCTTTLLKSTPE